MNRLGLREPIAVFGAGVEGRAVLAYLSKHQITGVTALDRNEIKGLPSGVNLKWGKDHDVGLRKYSTVFRSPGVRPDHPGLEEVRRSGGTVTSAVSFFLKRCPAPVVGVTGTLGKGTAASLIAAMFEEGGFHTRLGGNIGQSPLDFLDDLGEESRVVLELSSFQCMDLEVSPPVAAVLKTTSEHLDWHISHDEYLGAKAQLLANQKDGDVVVFNADSEGSRLISVNAPKRLAYSLRGPVNEGIYLKGDRLRLTLAGESSTLALDLDGVRLKGRFNVENICAAVLAAQSLGCDVEAACRAAQAFKGLPHRLEFVTEAGEIQFYNDSYATRPEATLGALTCFGHSPLALVLGGSEKHADFGELVVALHNHPTLVKVCLIGDTAKRLREAIAPLGMGGFAVEEYDNLEPAVEAAVEALSSRGVVLLSPACASFGLFPNYKVRGERFRAKAAQVANRMGRSTE